MGADMTMNENDEQAFKSACEKHGHTDGYSMIVAHDMWQAACEWWDSQVGEAIPASRGYALLGSGQYVLNHTGDFHPELGAELIITFATESDKQGNRQIGEVRDNPDCGKPIEAKDMIIRIGFLNERGLFALENQLSLLRELHFPDSSTPPATLQPAVAVNEPERFENDAAWDLANKVRKDLDRKCCPGPFMDLAMEAINRHYKHASQCVDVDDKVVSALKGAAKALNKIDDWLKGRGYSGLKPSEIIILDELNAAIAAAEAAKKGGA